MTGTAGHDETLSLFREPTAPTPGSQEAKILRALQVGQTLTPLEALEHFGCFRLAARVNQLKGMGYPIRTTMITNERGKRFARYSL